jgi:hypothetical protein
MIYLCEKTRACEVAFSECFITDKLEPPHFVEGGYSFVIFNKSTFQRLKGIKLCAVNIRKQWIPHL